MPRSGIFSFAKIPPQNKFICKQDSEINGYRIYSHDEEIEILQIIAKTVTTRSVYRVVRSSDGVAIATISRDKLENKYVISGTHDQELAVLRIDEKMRVMIEISPNELYVAHPKQRSKIFAFMDSEEKLFLTVDKKLITLNDIYEVSHIENFPSLIAQLVPIIIDDAFHEGIQN